MPTNDIHKLSNKNPQTAINIDKLFKCLNALNCHFTLQFNTFITFFFLKKNYKHFFIKSTNININLC